jgi:hypothetical protein
MIFRVFCGLGFICDPLYCAKIAPPPKATIYRQNVAWASKFGPSTSFFVNFDFSYFFIFF